LINQINQIFKLKKLKLWLRPYEILATGPDCGLIEFVNDTMSLDEVHRSYGSLNNYFQSVFGPNRKSKAFKKAQSNFMQSLAAYSLVCYVLQIKDRHNQNIMIDQQGHIIHIDFGFLLSNQPGKGLKFEKAPFKLTTEFIAVIDDQMPKFRQLMAKGFRALQEHADKVLVLVEMMLMGHNDLKCFEGGDDTVRVMKRNLFPEEKLLSKDEA
jgi:phosphatidylinositol 4-kinase B